MGKSLRPLSGLLLVLLPACIQLTEPADPSLEFQGGLAFGVPTYPISARGQAGAIKVTGVIPTPTSDYTLSAKFTLEGNHLVFEVSADQERDGYPLPVQQYYQGIIHNLPRGSYDLTVIHNLNFEPPSRQEVYHNTIHVH